MSACSRAIPVRGGHGLTFILIPLLIFSALDYVMSLAINPKDTNTFASACLDRTVKIWSLGSSTPNFQLEAHETKGVNKPYLLTTSDDVRRMAYLILELPVANCFVSAR
jgi:WD40 repeat protein